MGSKENNYIERYWRDATPQDAIREPPMVARFRDDGDNGWLATDILLYHDRSMHPWHNKDGISYEHCQVYDAPDPGEGWRLIDVWEETKQEGDEFWSLNGSWKSATSNMFFPLHFYRRRIEQPKSEPKYVPFTWEDREQLRGRWIVDGDGDEHCIVRLELYQEIFFINGASAEDALEDWHFLDTGEPFGKRVQ